MHRDAKLGKTEMKTLVLGAGAIGGYFGGRLVQAGADVSFLVRERRAAQLRERGLIVRSPHGDFSVPVRALTKEQIEDSVDLVLLTCKAYDLDPAIDSIARAVGAHTTVLPLLNGLAHIERLQAAFGPARIAGGSCGIPATLTPDGEVVQLGGFHRIVFGVLPGTSAHARAHLAELEKLYRATPVDVELSNDMMLALWGEVRRAGHARRDDLPDARRGGRHSGGRRGCGLASRSLRRLRRHCARCGPCPARCRDGRLSRDVQRPAVDDDGIDAARSRRRWSHRRRAHRRRYAGASPRRRY